MHLQYLYGTCMIVQRLVICAVGFLVIEITDTLNLMN